jgi:alpha-amylase
MWSKSSKLAKMSLLIVSVLFLFLDGCRGGLTASTNTTSTTPIAQTTAPISTEKTLTPTHTPTTTATIFIEESTKTPTPLPTVTSLPGEMSIDANWWQDTIFYEIFVRSFYDSNADGIGDFNGIIQKLDYLNDGDASTSTDLGISGLWLMPIMLSPTTHGYDVTDFYQVNPQYGTLDDFKELLTQAHVRGIRVILDLPLNHTSVENPWFIQSQDPLSPYRDWYIWSPTDPGYRGPWNQVVWHRLNGEYFYGFFWEGMPDLNYKNPQVTEEMHNVARFWLEDIGVDGFRLDAIGDLIEEGTQQIETSATHQWLRDFYQFYKGVNLSAFTVGEVWMDNTVVAPYIKNKEVDLAFNFDLSAAILQGINEANPGIITAEIQRSKDLFPESRYGIFATNHDMERVVTQLGNNLQKAKVAASIYLTLPGVPFIYYGEEIGMSGIAPDEQCRLPMQWTSNQYAGFSTAPPWKPPQPDYGAINVGSEETNPLSILSHYHKLISLRNNYTALRKGEVFVNTCKDQSIISTTLTYEGKAILVIINLSDQAIKDFSLGQSAGILPTGSYDLVDLFDSNHPAGLEINSSGGFENFQPVEQIQGYETLIFEIVPANL